MKQYWHERVINTSGVIDVQADCKFINNIQVLYPVIRNDINQFWLTVIPLKEIDLITKHRTHLVSKYAANYLTPFELPKMVDLAID